MVLMVVAAITDKVYSLCLALRFPTAVMGIASHLPKSNQLTITKDNGTMMPNTKLSMNWYPMTEFQPANFSRVRVDSVGRVVIPAEVRQHRAIQQEAH